MWWLGQTEQMWTQFKPDLRFYLRTARPNIKQQAVKVVVLLPWLFGDFRRHLYLSVPPSPDPTHPLLGDVMIQRKAIFRWSDEIQRKRIKQKNTTYVSHVLSDIKCKLKSDKETTSLSTVSASFWLTVLLANHSAEFCWDRLQYDQSERTALWGVLPLCRLCVDIGGVRGNFNISFIIRLH